MSKRKYNQEIQYYKDVYRKKILYSKPIVCDKDSKIELHILTCKEDLLNTLWSLKTFYYYSELRPRLIIHDDGTLTNNEINIYFKHFVNHKLIKRKEADIALRKYLRNYKFSQKYRFDNHKVHSIKLLDSLLCSETKQIMIHDSDILFFKKPSQIISCIKNKRGFFMSDYKNSYSLSMNHLNNLFNMKLRNNINSGIIYSLWL